jgi:hypothetical protein
MELALIPKFPSLQIHPCPSHRNRTVVESQQVHIAGHLGRLSAMLIRTLLFAAVLVLASAKINLPKPKHIQIESLTPFDAPLDVNGEPISFAGAVVVDGVSQTNHMDMNCNNKFCSMMLFAVVSTRYSVLSSCSKCS